MRGSRRVTNSLAEFRARSHFGGLNGLRALAIAMVVWHHAYSGSIHPLDRGFLGVDLFFVLSGFLITTLLLREREATGSIALGRFWIRRALRLFPPYYTLLALLAAYYAHRGGAPAEGFFHTLPTDLVYLSNWRPSEGPNLGILWSLATEQQFYLVWPLVEIAGRRIAVPVLILFIGLNQMLNFGLLGATAALPILQATFTPICLGVLLAHLLDSARSHDLLARPLAAPVAVYGVAALCMLVMTIAPDDIAGAPRLAIQLLIAILIGAIVMQPHGTCVRLLEAPPLERIGIVSYGIYLIHLCVMTPAAALLRRMELDSPLMTFLLTFALSWAAAEVSFRLLERPILAFSRRFRAPRKDSIAPLMAGPGL